MEEIKRKDILYYARIIPNCGIYDVLEAKVRTVKEDWFVAIEKRDKHAFLFDKKDLNNVVFFSRQAALNKVKEAEKNKKQVTFHTVYEEY